MNRNLLRIGAAALALAVCAAVATAVQRRAPGTAPESAHGAKKSGGAPVQPAAPMYAAASPAPAGGAAATSAPGASAPGASAPGASVPLRPAIAEGRTALRDGMFAERHGDTVTVSFDTELARTRRPEKFEQIVRATLPTIYGPAADSLLAHLPTGTLAGAGDLLTDLPARGLHLPAPGGATIALWPTTRPGRDGPLVVTYRVVAGR
ncbi:MAG: hypothetical protein ACJ79S_20970 [Gemmatimonadaceae bacterium]